MSINLQKNQVNLCSAFNSVLDPLNSINWALFSYEGRSNVLKIAETGEGGLEELATCFNCGKVQYAVTTVECPATKQPKVVLIHWQGDGVSSDLLGSTASHVHEVKKFFKGIHLTHHARCEDDVEPRVILEAVEKVLTALKTTSGSRQPDRGNDGSDRGVSSVYRHVTADISLTDRNQFWNQVDKDEKQRLSEERERMMTMNERMEDERRRLEQRFDQEKSNEQIPGHRPAEDRKEIGGLTSVWENREPPRKVMTNDERSNVPTNTSQERPTTFPNNAAMETDSIAVFGNALPPRQAESDDELQNDAWEEETIPKMTNNDVRVSTDSGLCQPTESLSTPIAVGKGLEAVALWDYQAEDDTEISFNPNDVICNIDQIDSGWWRGTGPDGSFGLFPANYVQLIQ